MTESGKPNTLFSWTIETYSNTLNYVLDNHPSGVKLVKVSHDIENGDYATAFLGDDSKIPLEWRGGIQATLSQIDCLSVNINYSTIDTFDGQHHIDLKSFLEKAVLDFHRQLGMIPTLKISAND
jgi:hypothetical protein